MSASSLLAKAPVFKPFKLALIQLGNIGADKAANLQHARTKILEAGSKKPDLIVLPVSVIGSRFLFAQGCGFLSTYVYHIPASLLLDRLYLPCERR